MINLDKCSESCNAVDDLSAKICVLGKTKDVNAKVFNMIARINEATTLVKHISCDYQCYFNILNCNSDEKWNNETCRCQRKTYSMCTKNYSGNPNTCICKDGKY